jgi:hypothetical protein
MAQNINGLESYFPVHGSIHEDETIDGSVGTLAALEADTRLVIVSPSVAINVTFDGTIPVTSGHGHFYGAWTLITMNEYTASLMKFVCANTGETGFMSVTEMQRT